MKKLKFRDKFQYAFDNTMAKGPSALIFWLGVLTLLIIMIVAAVFILFHIGPEDGDPPPFGEGLWLNLMHTLDAGNLAGAMGWAFRFVLLFVTLSGIFIVSTLIGIISNGINSKLENMRKGRSFVIEKNHTLILGWSSKIFTIISELSIANQNQKNPCIVILAQKDKVEMDEEIKHQVANLRNTRIVCRSGNPCDITDLHISNPYDSKSIIILHNESPDGDSESIKTILAITNNPNRRPEPYSIVAEFKEQSNLDVAKMVALDELEAILSDELVARIMVQTSRQSGLSSVYVELLDFDGVEIYFTSEKTLEGKTYGEALFAYEDSAVIGIQKKEGGVMINPAQDTLVHAGDKIIAISEDDDTIKVSVNKPMIQEEVIRNGRPAAPLPEKTLMLGWNKRARAIIREMETYVSPGSSMKIITRNEISGQEAEEIQAALTNIATDFITMDTANRAVLDSLRVDEYDHILLLCYDDMNAQEADSLTLITLLHLRDIAEKKNVDLSIVSEMYDIRNRELAEVTKADDFIVSDKLISLVLTQVSENKQLMRVFDEMFNAEGSEIYLKPVELFVATGTPVNFHTVVESVRRNGQTAIGYRMQSQSGDATKAYGIKVNPVKSEMVTFTSGDLIIVISES
jgi:ion channel POLLUX/CASTOR